MRSIFSLGFAAMLAVPLFVRSAEPSHYAFSPQPPGAIVQSVPFYPVGQAANSQWRAVVSKKLIATSGHTQSFQWYLSLYAIGGGTYTLQYRSPGTDTFLSAVKKYAGSLWLPDQNAKIDGVGRFVQNGVDDLVVEKYEASADCGGGEVAVFYYNWATQKIGKSVTVINGCELHAKVIRDKLGYAIQLNGPYYGPNAPMCCPTKQNVTAILRYVRGHWTMQPKYFTF